MKAINKNSVMYLIVKGPRTLAAGALDPPPLVVVLPSVCGETRSPHHSYATPLRSLSSATIITEVISTL